MIDAIRWFNQRTAGRRSQYFREVGASKRTKRGVISVTIIMYRLLKI